MLELDAITKRTIATEGTVKHALRHALRKAVPKQPDSLKDLVIEGEWATTAGPEPENFLFHDNGKDSCQRIVVFATTDGLKQLAKASTWFMDGCFDIAPKLFLQLYVIRVPLGQSTISALYALFKKKPNIHTKSSSTLSWQSAGNWTYSHTQ